MSKEVEFQKMNSTVVFTEILTSVPLRLDAFSSVTPPASTVHARSPPVNLPSAASLDKTHCSGTPDENKSFPHLLFFRKQQRNNFISLTLNVRNIFFLPLTGEKYPRWLWEKKKRFPLFIPYWRISKGKCPSASWWCCDGGREGAGGPLLRVGTKVLLRR